MLVRPWVPQSLVRFSAVSPAALVHLKSSKLHRGLCRSPVSDGRLEEHVLFVPTSIVCIHALESVGIVTTEAGETINEDKYLLRGLIRETLRALSRCTTYSHIDRAGDAGGEREGRVV